MKKSKPAPRTPPRRDFVWPLLIFGSVFVAYFPALDGRMLWDDFGHVTVPELRSFHGLWRIWTEPGATQQYYPLLHSAFWLEHQLWGESTLGYHLANIILHSSAAVLVVLILRRLAIPGALLGGFLFALHPVAVESVAWIAEQKNTLSAVFYLASAYVFLRAGLKPCATAVGTATVTRTANRDRSAVNRDRSVAPGPSRSEAGGEISTIGCDLSVAQGFSPAYWLAFALFICALLSKTITATLPAALLVVLWWHRGRIEWRRDVVPLVPWFAAAAIAGVFTIWFERHIIGAQGAAFGLSAVERILLAGRVIVFYLGKLAWPVNLIFVYPRWTIDASVWWQYLYPAAAAALAGGLVLMRWRGTLAGYLFFCGTLVPVLGFVNVYPFVFSYVADHFQYLAALGIIVPVASGLTILATTIAPKHRRVLTASIAALVVGLGAMTWSRSAVYEDVETLFRDTVERNPQAWMAWQNLGTELAAQNRFAEAIDAYEGALRARTDYEQARRNLVLARMKLGDGAAGNPQHSSEAIAQYQAVLRLDPHHFRAHYNLGTLLMDVRGRQSEAIAHLEKAVMIQPDSVEARVNLGVVLSDVPSRREEAITHLEAAVSARPDLPVRELLERLRGGRDSGRP